MLFNSYSFLLFLPSVFLLYWLLPRRRGWQNALLLVASYVFYAFWDVRFLALIAGITLCGWTGGLAIARFGAGSRRGKWVCAGCAVACLAVLGAFKYYDFFVSEFNALMAGVGWQVCLPLWRVALPVGISFYTFQVVGYVVDVWRGRVQACRQTVDFATFVAYFPQLVAGPIERASDLLPQLAVARRPRYEDVAAGLRQMLWGFAKKMLVADRCAPVVAAIYGNPQSDGTDLWAAAFLFAMQIYGDFSGYSDIAVGVSRLFGLRLTRNFAVPYFSRSVGEFWRRWHVTLMSWFRDYIYIPLGGSRRGRARTLRNTAVVFLVSGLWHGADWTFVAWGAYFALWAGLAILSGRGRKPATPIVAQGRLLPSWRELGQMAATFLIVCVGWVWFRSESIASAFHRLGAMCTDLPLHTPCGGFSAFLPPLLMLLTEWAMRRRAHGLDFRGTGLLRFRAVRWGIYYALILATLYWGGAQTAFIYFQF